MKLSKRLGGLLLALAMMLAMVAGCSSTAEVETTPEPTPEPTVEVTAEPTPEPTVEVEPTEEPEEAPTLDIDPVSIAILQGPTGMGAAKLWADSDADVTAINYDFSMATDPATEIVPKLINGELDVAALSTNLAATLYHKTEGGIQLLALNTLSVLQILENGSTISTMKDLAGKTIYATGQGSNPEYILNYLLELNGLTPGEDVTIEWLASEEVVAMMVSGQADICMLPIPASTTVMSKNADIRTALDLSDVWDDAGCSGTLTMGCLVATTAWIEEVGDNVVDMLLAEYAASIDFALTSSDEAAVLMTEYGITASEAIASAAIPNANLVCITGADMREIQDYYEVLFAADPTSIGGSIPDDAIYYISK